MISGIQIVLMGFSVVMVFITYNYYRRKNLEKRDLLIWVAVWVVLFLAALFPQSISFFVQNLHIERGMDFFTIFGFVFLLIVVFVLYVTVFKMQSKIEAIISAISQKEKHRKK